MASARGHEIEHFDALRVERSDLNNPLSIGTIASTTRRYIDRLCHLR